MGNKFNKRTTIVLRPPVCKSPPPPPHPTGPEPVITPCCPLGVPQLLRWQVTATTCPQLVGKNVLLVNSGLIGGHWLGTMPWPDNANTVDVDLECSGTTWVVLCYETGSPGNLIWQDFTPAPATEQCTPFEATWNVRVRTGYVIGGCSGTARNFTFEISPA